MNELDEKLTSEEALETVENAPVEDVAILQEEVVETPQKVKKPKNPVIQNDIMRYKKNKFASSLALLGLAFGCVYFMVLYAQVNDVYYTWEIAFDVIYNLFFLLLTFLLSEQVKNYNRKLFPLQMVIGALQVARIFWLPLTGITAEVPIPTGSFIAMVVALAGSGALIIASGLIGLFRSLSVEKFMKKLENGEVDLDKELKEETTVGGEVNA